MIKQNLNQIRIDTYKDHGIMSPRYVFVEFCFLTKQIFIFMRGNGLCQALCVADVVYMRFMNNKKRNIKIYVAFLTR